MRSLNSNSVVVPDSTLNRVLARVAAQLFAAAV